MYYCDECGGEFKTPIKITEAHGLTHPPFEESYACPICKSTAFHEKSRTHCRCCGARLKITDTDYCSDACKKKGEKFWLKQQLRYKSELESPVNKIIREMNFYNLQHNTNYSYGQFVALKQLQKASKKKCVKKKSNT